MSSLSGRTALVTGAGVGIGQGVALELARQGAAVAVHYARSEQGARQTVEQIQAEGGSAVLLSGDLSQVADCRRIVDETVAQLDGIDILVNNGGVTLTRPFLETDQEAYDRIMGINMRGYYFCAQQAVPQMEQRGGGVILNMSSVHGRGGAVGHTVYAATKGAIDAFTRALAIELAPKKIRVNAVAPGLIEVPRYFETMPDYTTASGAERVPWGRVGTPADVANLVLFLVSDAADFITGQVIYVDGGSTARLMIARLGDGS